MKICKKINGIKKGILKIKGLKIELVSIGLSDKEIESSLHLK